MNQNARICSFVALTLAALSGCSSQPAADQAKKAGAAVDKIQGKAQVITDLGGGATDAALNAGGPSVYIWEGARRYRLFLKAPVTVVHDNQYVVEGVNAQKAIDQIGDPDGGKNGYPLQASCDHVVRMAWSGLAFDDLDARSALVRATVKRYPARPLFLVTRIRPATPAEISAAPPEPKKDEALTEVSIPAEKERASLIDGQTVQAAPLWEPKGGTASCKVLINSEGQISELQTGAQLCEAVQWSQFHFKPAVQGGKPVKVATEVEVKFEPRK